MPALHHPELLEHLKLVPYLRLDHSFDAAEVLAEASALRKMFREHRSQPGWRALAIISPDGNSQSTESQSYHGFETQNKGSRLTEIARLCPSAVAQIQSLIDVTACWRARFMLLEPGAVVPTHRDVREGPAVVLYFSIYQPRGCEYRIDLNEDGSHNQTTFVIPLTAGSSYLINVAAYHKIENKSEEERFALIVEGPGPFDELQLLALARRQNGWLSLDQLCAAGLEKFLRSRRQ